MRASIQLLHLIKNWFGANGAAVSAVLMCVTLMRYNDKISHVLGISAVQVFWWLVGMNPLIYYIYSHSGWEFLTKFEEFLYSKFALYPNMFSFLFK